MASIPPELRLDIWNYVGFGIESILNVAQIPLIVILAWVCVKQNHFHRNFRLLISIANAANFVLNLQRLMVVPVRICCAGNGNSTLIDGTLLPLAFSSYLFMTTWTILATERMVASYRCMHYEKACSTIGHAFIFGGSAFLSAVVVVFIGYTSIYFWHFSMGAVTFTLLSLHLLLVIIIAIVSVLLFTIVFQLLPFIIVYNKRVYARRHNDNLDMPTRYQLDENIRATRYILPVAVICVIGKLIHTLVMCYSAIFTDIPLGMDTTYLQHAYDILLSLIRILTTGWLVLTNDRIGLKPWRRHSKVASVTDQDKTETYFNDLRVMWA